MGKGRGSPEGPRLVSKGAKSWSLYVPANGCLILPSRLPPPAASTRLQRAGTQQPQAVSVCPQKALILSRSSHRARHTLSTAHTALTHSPGLIPGFRK